MTKYLRTLWHAYSATAVTFLSALIALVVLDALLSMALTVRAYLSLNPISTRYGKSTVSSVYQGWSDREVDALLKETWSRPFIYEPFTQFKERPYRGSYVNVDDAGFRVSKDQGPWPPQSQSLNVFMFGGSTTFGYGVQDDHTIASHLQEYVTARLNREVRVYNFGRGHYYSTQERILYEELLASGLVPHMAIFVDGLNEFYYKSNEPEFTRELREFVSSQTVLGKVVSGASFSRAARWFAGKTATDADGREARSRKVLDRVIERYVANVRLIEAVSMRLAVTPVFVWQPIPTYQYDLQYHPFSNGGFGRHSDAQSGYARMAEVIERTPPGDNFLWCADIQRNETAPLYVDKVHYSGGFSRRLATVIGDMLIERYPVVMARGSPEPSRK